MAIFEPWRTAAVPGQQKAVLTPRPEIAEAIGRSKRPVMVLGHLAAEARVNDADLIDYLIGLGKARRIPIIATGDVNRALLSKGYTQAAVMPAVDASHRLSDREWKGPDGKGPYDLAIFAGMPYYMEWTIQSGLGHHASHVRALFLKWGERYYPGSGTLPPISGPCPWKACLGPAQAFRSLIFRPGIARGGHRNQEG